MNADLNFFFYILNKVLLFYLQHKYRIIIYSTRNTFDFSLDILCELILTSSKDVGAYTKSNIRDYDGTNENNINFNDILDSDVPAYPYR